MAEPVAEVGRAMRAAALALAFVAAAAQAATHTITIDGMQFSPAELSVKRGDKVVWVNKDLVPHTATAAGLWDSGAIAPGSSWSTTVQKAGRHAYVCSLHPTMKAVLKVE